MTLLSSARDHPIRAFAVLCVALIAAFIGYMSYRINETLAGPGWCKTALGAEKISGKDATIQGLEACVDLLKIQLGSLSTNSHILFGSLALCLVTLIVVVIAGARLAGKFKDAELNIGRDAAAAGAQATAEAAQETADAITEGTKP